MALISNNTMKNCIKTKADRAWFSRLLRYPARKWSGSILTTLEPARGSPSNYLYKESSIMCSRTFAEHSSCNSLRHTWCSAVRTAVHSMWCRLRAGHVAWNSCCRLAVDTPRSRNSARATVCPCTQTSSSLFHTHTPWLQSTQNHAYARCSMLWYAMV